ncbi:N-acetylmuramic acid/N-acetylglucosamine kinase [Paenibacillus allorhizoplanae]|uniref:N-acetylmuramic acid/N-acetylglucosamine kinase n=1 Tax=Paenibacillus allorhizoplanae TaxID=2905648 RepID=A0ABN8GQQ5_9BACL|nr:BadF/BadG/BcrA/BcrD ATPase family protein [Paenibacillus allorhizoplanae]CAH1213863.1 N-acetylmuramic acid/N-acetylglucosamine kinase [Paenibacillus allorhizoplanae]
MKRYVAGLDGGGTKTAVTIVDESGLEVHTFTSGAINYNGQDEASVQASLAEIFRTIDRVCDGLGHCAQVCIGAAGVSNPTVTTRLESSVRACGYKGPLFITGDQDTALSGAHNRELGIILIAGTGSICYGKNEAGDTHRAGGYGYLIDDEGSGYSIGRDLLSVVVRAHDGRLPATVITGMVFEQLGMTSIQQIIGFVYDKQTNKKDIAALAPILSQACELGDEAALAIADKSARSLLELVVPVTEKLSMQEGVLAMAGSALLKNSFIQTAFINGLKERYPAMTCITPKRDAASGAALMALNRLQ